MLYNLRETKETGSEHVDKLRIYQWFCSVPCIILSCCTVGHGDVMFFFFVCLFVRKVQSNVFGSQCLFAAGEVTHQEKGMFLVQIVSRNSHIGTNKHAADIPLPFLAMQSLKGSKG